MRGGVAGSPPMSTALHRSPNKLRRSNSIFKLWLNPQSRQSAKLFLQSSELGLPQPPHPQASVPPPPHPRFWGGGGAAHSLAREGLRESQFRRGDIHCGTLYMYVLCGLNPSPGAPTHPGGGGGGGEGVEPLFQA
jgi:hypothetical protein